MQQLLGSGRQGHSAPGQSAFDAPPIQDPSPPPNFESTTNGHPLHSTPWLLLLSLALPGCVGAGEGADGPCGPDSCGLGSSSADDGSATTFAATTGGSTGEPGDGAETSSPTSSGTGTADTGGSQAEGSTGESTTGWPDSSTSSDATSDSSTGSEGTGSLPPGCGDGRLDVAAGEVCDAGADNGAYDGSCDLDCQGPGRYCGDGIVTPGEEACDDGNQISDDGCDADCQISAVSSIDAGGAHNCVILRTGAVKCWGRNTFGQLGYGTTANIGDNETPAEVAQPVQIGGPAEQLSLGTFHSCALLTDGRVKCWGHGSYGQLGYGNTENIGDDELPNATGVGFVNVGAPVLALATASGWSTHTCALLEGGAVKCWGGGAALAGALGQGSTDGVGDNESPASVRPVPLVGAASAVFISERRTCVRMTTNRVRCWGRALYDGLGNGGTEDLGDNPGEIANLSDIRFDNATGSFVTASHVATGGVHACVSHGSAVHCWGNGYGGKLGNGDSTGVARPSSATASVLAGQSAEIVQLEAGAMHTCALDSEGALGCWGSNNVRQLGTGGTANVGDDPGEVAARVDFGDGVRAVAVTAGDSHTCVLLSTGGVRCWGLNDAGQLGYGDTVVHTELPGQMGDVELF